MKARQKLDHDARDVTGVFRVQAPRNRQKDRAAPGATTLSAVVRRSSRATTAIASPKTEKEREREREREREWSRCFMLTREKEKERDRADKIT